MQGDTVRLTYAEAAARLGCLEKSVATRAKRRGWKREKGNDGLMRVHVPADSLPDSNGDNRGDSIPDTRPTVREAELTGQINVLQAKLEAATEKAQGLEKALAEAGEREAWLRQKLDGKPRRWWHW
jgi:hypothetical protein